MAEPRYKNDSHNKTTTQVFLSDKNARPYLSGDTSVRPDLQGSFFFPPLGHASEAVNEKVVSHTIFLRAWEESSGPNTNMARIKNKNLQFRRSFLTLALLQTWPRQF